MKKTWETMRNTQERAFHHTFILAGLLFKCRHGFWILVFGVYTLRIWAYKCTHKNLHKSFTLVRTNIAKRFVYRMCRLRWTTRMVSVLPRLPLDSRSLVSGFFIRTEQNRTEHTFIETLSIHSSYITQLLHGKKMKRKKINK